MGKSFCIASGKGGVGKSTVSSSLAQVFAKEGLSVALLDADVGLRCMDLMLDMQDRVIFDFADVMEKQCTLQEALYSAPGCEKLHLLSASQILRASEIRPKDVFKITQSLKRTHDIVLVDCPAGIGRNFKINMGSVDEYILVGTPDDVSMRDVERVGQILGEQGVMHPYLIMNRIDKGMVKRGEMTAPQAFSENLDMPLLGVVPDSPMVYRALLKHKTGYHCGDRKVEKAFERIAKRMMGADIPVKDMRPRPVERFFLRARV